MNKIQLDECYSIESTRNEVTLKYRCESDEINEKTGKNKMSRTNWYYPNVKLAIKQYLLVSLTDCTEISQMLNKLGELENIIDEKFKNK